MSLFDRLLAMAFFACSVLALLTGVADVEACDMLCRERQYFYDWNGGGGQGACLEFQIPYCKYCVSGGCDPVPNDNSTKLPCSVKRVPKAGVPEPKDEGDFVVVEVPYRLVECNPVCNMPPGGFGWLQGTMQQLNPGEWQMRDLMTCRTPNAAEKKMRQKKDDDLPPPSLE